jgi:hypothetical protein
MTKTASLQTLHVRVEAARRRLAHIRASRIAALQAVEILRGDDRLIAQAEVEFLLMEEHRLQVQLENLTQARDTHEDVWEDPFVSRAVA